MVAGDSARTRSWTAKDYILAALGGCLAAISIVIIVLVILRPARIIFFITHASLNDAGDGAVNLNFTIFANNTSQRAKVRFISFFVTVTNGRSFTDAHVERAFPFPRYGYMSVSGVMNITASVHLPAGDMVSSFDGQPDEKSTSRLTVVLTSQMQFQIGVAPTKIFDTRVSCPQVTFVKVPPKSPAQASFRCDG